MNFSLEWENVGVYKYKTHLYCLAVDVGFYIDVWSFESSGVGSIPGWGKRCKLFRLITVTATGAVHSVQIVQVQHIKNPKFVFSEKAEHVWTCSFPYNGRTSMVRTSLEPWKSVLDISISSHWELNIAPGQEANMDNLGMSARFSIK